MGQESARNLHKMKKAQILGLSFQMIFSIILIAVFIYVAMIGIKAFLSYGNAAKTANFVVDFRSDLENAIGAYSFSKDINYSLPSSITSLCFTPDTSKMLNPPTSGYDELNPSKYSALSGKGNHVFFYPMSKQTFLGQIRYAFVDCAKTCLNLTVSGMTNPYCIPVTKGIATITIKKDSEESYVKIS